MLCAQFADARASIFCGFVRVKSRYFEGRGALVDYNASFHWFAIRQHSKAITCFHVASCSTMTYRKPTKEKAAGRPFLRGKIQSQTQSSRGIVTAKVRCRVMFGDVLCLIKITLSYILLLSAGQGDASSQMVIARMYQEGWQLAITV